MTSTLTAEDKAELFRELDERYAPATALHDLDRLRGWQRKVSADGSFGRILNGPQWLDGVAVRDETVSARKLTASMVISTVFTTAEDGPRVAFSQAGFEAYGEVNAVLERTFWVDPNSGDFAFGHGDDSITFDAAQGKMTVPAAIIENLTIAQVGSGIIAGTYGTGASGARVELSPSGLQAYNASNDKTFELSGAAGDLSMTGTFIIQSAASGSRVDIRNTGIRLYNGSAVRTQFLNDGSGYIGSTTGVPSGAAISWGTNGSVSIAGAFIENNSITAGKLNVSTLSSISADIGTITAGSITANTITTGTLNGALLGTNSVSGGALSNLTITGAKIANGTITNAKIDSLEASKITAGTLSANVTNTGTLTIGTGGRIQWGNNFIADGIVNFQSGSSETQHIYFRRSTGTVPEGWISHSATSSLSRMYIWSLGTGSRSAGIFLDGASTQANTQARFFARSDGGFDTGIYAYGTGRVQALSTGITAFEYDTTGRFIAANNIFPGGQTSQYLSFRNSRIGLNGTLSGSAGAVATYIELDINGTVRKIPCHAV